MQSIISRNGLGRTPMPQNRSPLGANEPPATEKCSPYSGIPSKYAPRYKKADTHTGYLLFFIPLTETLQNQTQTLPSRDFGFYTGAV